MLNKNLMSITVALMIGATGYCQPAMQQLPKPWPDAKPPVASKTPKELVAHGDTRIDDYYWMNDFFKKGPDSTRVVKYLNQENDYYSQMMKNTESLQENLY